MEERERDESEIEMTTHACPRLRMERVAALYYGGRVSRLLRCDVSILRDSIFGKSREAFCEI